MILSSIKTFGHYCMFLTQVFRIPDKWSVTLRKTLRNSLASPVEITVAMVPTGPYG